MRVRRATLADRETIRELWDEFGAEIPEPLGPGESWEEAWTDLAEHVGHGAAFLAEDDHGPVGYAFAAAPRSSIAHLTDVYVRPRARRTGVARALLGDVVQALHALGVEHVTLDVLSSNTVARAVWECLGFTEIERTLATRLDALGRRVGGGEAAGATFGSVHVQTDDRGRVETAAHGFLPRLGPSAGTVVSQPRNGWVAVYDELCDRDPAALRRLGLELSNRLGGVVLVLGVEEAAVVRYIALDRGRILDEYLSIPEYFGELPPGDAIALRANPTVMARLTGADPGRLRAVARTGTSPGELPAATHLLREIAATLGIEGGDHGFAEPAPERRSP